jgi:nucleoside-diphosphate-sugar epimerase
VNVAITGGSGFIGRKLLDALVRQGHAVKVLSRRSPPAFFSSDIQVVTGDLIAPDCPLGQFVRGREVLFHCAGEVGDAAAMRLLHVEGTRRLLKAVLNEAVQTGRSIHWVQLSSVGVYGPPSPAAKTVRVVTEDTPTCPQGEYEVTKTLADELVLQACRRGPMTCSIVRPSNVFGAAMPNPSLRSLGAMVRRGLFFYIGRAGAVATYVHVDDVVETLLQCGTDPRAKGETFNLSNDCLLEEMMGGMASALGVRKPSWRLPESLVRAGVFLAAKVVAVPLTQDRIDALVSRTSYPCLKLEQKLGFVPRRSVPDSIGEILK